MGGKAGGLFVNLGINTGQFQKGLRGAKGQLTAFQKVGAGLKGMFNPLTVGLGAAAALGAVIADVVGIFTDFEKATSKLEAVLGATDAEMDALNQSAKDLGSTTAFTASEVSSLQTEFAKLGFPTQDILLMTASTLDAAAALGSELGEQAALTGAVLKQYGLDATQAARVNDVMAKAASSSALDFSKLATAMPIVGATANAVGVSFERTAALLGKLSDAGMDASSAGSSLRNMFLELSNKGLTFQEAMDKIGNSSDKAKTSFDLFGKRGAAMGVTLQAAGVTIDELEASLKNADGTAKEMADTMLDNLSGDITKASSAWEGFILSLEDGEGVISKAMRSVVSGATNVLGAFTELANGGLSVEDQFKRIGNSLIKLANATNLYAQITGKGLIPLMDVQKDKVEAFESALKKQNVAQLDTFKGVTKIVNKYKEYGLTTKEAQDRTNALIESMKGSGTVLPIVEDNVEVLTTKVNKLTKAQEKAALKTRNLSLNLSGLKDQLSKSAKLKVEVPMELSLPEGGTFEGVKPEMVTGAEQLGSDVGEALSNSLKMAASGALVGLGEAIGSGEIANMGDQLTMAFSGLLSSFGQQMIQLGIGMIAFQTSLSSLNPAVAIGAGVALVAAASAIRSSLQEGATGFAQGGMVTGSVFANVGEGRGTTKSNPEVIAPLDKLRNMIGDSQGASLPSKIELFVSGNNLTRTLRFDQKLNKYS